MYEMVRSFLYVSGRPVPDVPERMRDDLAMLWQRLDEEETREYYDALKVQPMAGVAKDLADRIYILLGHAATMGLTRFDEIFAEVHRSNMSKLGADGKPVLRSDGKVLKGPKYTPPDLTGLV
jgi:predicted HAD superfamily Cof-like phosphohydrolase